jgi:hypothetical protein
MRDESKERAFGLLFAEGVEDKLEDDALTAGALFELAFDLDSKTSSRLGDGVVFGAAFAVGAARLADCCGDSPADLHALLDVILEGRATTRRGRRDRGAK